MIRFSKCAKSTGRLQVARKPRHHDEWDPFDGRLHIDRKPRQYDEWDPYVPPYDPYGPGCERNR